ncbi:MAG TPA: ATP-binding protein [Vicinamibacterales bacterium]|jgi:signal transduction histidine kinase|nr:ATP-binding protein [Vicinamibacterales bacterium]
MRVFASLTNRIFLGSALLAVLAIAAAIYNVNRAVSRQAEQELLRGLEEAGTLIEENRRVQVDGFAREARLIADLPRFKSAVYERDSPTALGVAREYQQQIAADLFMVTDRQGKELARIVRPAAAHASYERLAGVREAQAGREASWFWPYPGGVLQVVTVPVWIGPDEPEILGTLSVGFTLDDAVAARFRMLTNSDIAFGVGGAIQASTLPPAAWPRLVPLIASTAPFATVALDDGEYVGMTRTLSRPANGEGAAASRAQAPAAVAIVLRSRTERLRFLTALHTRLLATALVAVLAATLLSYAIARTVTRPLGAITATMREMSATGDLTRRLPARAGGRWDDEDARLLASTFNTMTESIGRFQHEAAQRERLSSLGRLSTVVAHEVRNPLMIIRAALRTLRQRAAGAPELSGPIADIDEETARLNRIVSEVLDFAKPIRFEMAPVEVNRVCEDAVRAVREGTSAPAVTLRPDPGVPRTTVDGERLRLTLVNLLSNASAAVSERHGGAPPPDAIVLTTTHRPGWVGIEVRDRGAGIAPENLARVFDPFFTTRRTGTGLGLAISRNIIEGMGGTITIDSRPGHGTLVRLELPVRS